MTWKYTDESRSVAYRTLADGGMESRLATQITDWIDEPDAQTKDQRKATALASATAAGFTLDQVRVIRDLMLLTLGTEAQKTKAQALLAPLLQLCIDAKITTAAIDADEVPAPIVPLIRGTDDP